MKLTLSKLTDVYDEDAEGIPFLIRKNVRTKIHVDLRDIISIEEMIGQNGKRSKTKSKIQIREQGPCIVQEKFAKLKKLKEHKEPALAIGFLKGIKR